MNQIISTPAAPAAIGPYSQAIQAGGLLFLSGTMPIDPATGALAEPQIAAQAEQVMKNIGAVLQAAGYTFEDVVKTTCFLADMADFAAFNEIYARYFTGKPARSCVAASLLLIKAKKAQSLFGIMQNHKEATIWQQRYPSRL